MPKYPEPKPQTRVERLREALLDIRRGGQMAAVNIDDLTAMVDEFEVLCAKQSKRKPKDDTDSK